MLNEVQTRNYSRYQQLLGYLAANTSVYSSYIPFNREAQSFTTNFNLLKNFVPQKDVNGISTAYQQKELKNKITLQVVNICDMATAYAEQYNDEKLAAAVSYSKSEVLSFKDSELYELVSNIINVLQPMLTDVHFMEYDITEEMLEKVMADVITFSDNLDTTSIMESRYAVANQKIYEITQLLDKNVQQFDRLINKFAFTHPEFVAGYHINAAPESPISCHTGIAGTVTCEADGTPVSNTIVSVASKKKEVFTDGMGKFAIFNMYGCECEMTVAASGFASKKTMVRVSCGIPAKVDKAI
jgi:hypothetical protein